MTTNELRAIGWSALTLLVGFSLSVHNCSFLWLARSGSVVTAVGIWFAGLGLRDRVETVPTFVEAQFEICLQEILAIAANGGISGEEAARAAERIKTEVQMELGSLARAASKRLLRVELSILIAGTLVWGFGDLVAFSFASCP